MDDQNDGDLIEHMVVSGGGHNILAMFGAVAYLKKKKFIDINSLKTYDGTSAGALLGFILLLNLEDEEIDNYLMNRPWEKMFNISPSMMFKAFQSKGLFNVGLMEQILEPLTKTADLNINITFAEFFERTGVEFTVYTTELNSLKNVIISYKTHPDMRVIDGLFRSCAVPPLFSPVIENNECFFDGGVFANYPLDHFFERHPDINEKKIFAVKLLYQAGENDTILDSSTINEYLYCIIKKLIQHIVIHKETTMTVTNELLIPSKGMSYETLKQTISSKEARFNLKKEGERYASVFYQYQTKEN